MEYTSLPQALEALEKLQSTLFAYNHAMGILSQDASTAAPEGSWEARGKTMEVLTKVSYDLTADPRNGILYDYLSAHASELTPIQARELEVLKKNCDRMRRIPAREYVDYSVLLNEADAVWHRAKPANDFAAFAPYLEKIVAYCRKFAGYYNPDMAPYDALLNEYEEGMNQETLDIFFARLRSAIVPLVEKIGKKPQIDDSFLMKHYPIEQQRHFSDYLMEVMGIDRTYCAIAETEHPFTNNFGSHDVRITTHYMPRDMFSNLYSVAHEGGHALYELNIDPAYDYTAVTGGATMGIHESQSRLFENYVGRSRAFVHCLYPTLRELFPTQLADVTEEEIWRAVNRAEPGLIRTEADELTYALHIMVRYEIEKALIQGTLAVADLPAAWNAKYKEYLGVDVPDNAHGCLQDIHWSMGDIGYFPSYALGSAYGAQAIADLRKSMDLDAQWAAGDMEPLKAALKERVWQWGSMKEPQWLVQSLCGGKFDPHYFTRYLKEKYTALYQL